MLTAMSQEKGRLIDALSDSEDLEIFKTDLIMDLIDFKWYAFAKKVHSRGFRFHIAMIVVTALYIHASYIGHDFGLGAAYNDLWIKGLLTTIGLLLIYPLVYDTTQLMKQGFKSYFSQFWNYIDLLNIYGGIFNLYMQIYHRDLHFTLYLYAMLIVCMLFKVFFFFRIKRSFSVITTMIMTCIYDLRIFMLFFCILCIFFGGCFSVLAPNP